MVKQLATYIESHKHDKITYKVNIKNEVEKYKRNNPGATNPMVIFDFIGTIPLLITSFTEVMCAGRQGLCIQRAEKIFGIFKDLGVDLVFFLDGPIKTMKFPEWCRPANMNYERHKMIFANLRADEPIQYRFNLFLKNYYENYLRVAKKYGRVFVSTDNECDIDLAEYATRMRPLAVCAFDTDFLIMPGDWPIWIPKTLNLRTMTVDVWNKGRLRKSLGLEQWQMPIFSILSSNDWIQYKLVEPIHKTICGEGLLKVGAQLQSSLAEFIRNEFQRPKDMDLKLADLIYNNGKCGIARNETTRLVQMSLDFYNYKAHKISKIEPDWLHDHVTKTATFNVLSIYKQRILHVPQPYIDVSKKDVLPFSELVLPILRREIGILYSNRRTAYQDIKYDICLKPSDEEPFAIKQFSPIFPDFEVPEIDDILEDDEDIVSVEKRVHLYIWVVGSKRKKPNFESVNKLLDTVFILPAMIANYLLLERQITMDEADILLLTIFETSRMDPIKAETIKPPEVIAERPFWLSFTYTNLIRHFEEAMTFCGLNRFVPYSYFDGYIFHKMYARFMKMPFDEKKSILKPIQEYRLYVL